MKKRVATIVMWTGLCLAARGGDDGRYTLDACIRIGLERSATAANARRDRAIAGTRVTQARSEALPQLDLSASYTRLDELQKIDLGDGSEELGTLDNYSASATARQVLYASGKVRTALRAADLFAERADQLRLETEAALVRDIRTGFYDLLLARERIAVFEKSVSQLASLRKQTEEKFRSGTASEFDLLSARVRLLNARPDLIGARNDYRMAREDFRRLLNMEDEPFAVVGELACRPVEADLDDLVAQALRERPALRAMEIEVALREAEARAAGAEGLPRLDAEFSYNGANSYGYVGFEDEWQWHWNAGVVLKWNLWDGGLTRATVKERRLRVEKGRTDLADFVRSVKLEVRRAYLDMRRALESVQAAQGGVELAAKALDIAAARHRTGVGTYLEFTDANLALQTAELTRLSALRDQLSAAARLDYACGRGVEPAGREDGAGPRGGDGEGGR